MKSRQTIDVLLLEDQPLISMDTEASLRSRGFERITPLAALASATAWLSLNQPDVVIMETTLRGQPSCVLVSELQSRGIAVIVYSGANRSLLQEHTAFDKVPWVSKPAEPDLLVGAIESVLSRPLAKPAPCRVSGRDDQVRIGLPKFFGDIAGKRPAGDHC